MHGPWESQAPADTEIPTHSCSTDQVPTALYVGQFSGLCDHQNTSGNAVTSLQPLTKSGAAIRCEFLQPSVLSFPIAQPTAYAELQLTLPVSSLGLGRGGKWMQTDEVHAVCQALG